MLWLPCIYVVTARAAADALVAVHMHCAWSPLFYQTTMSTTVSNNSRIPDEAVWRNVEYFLVLTLPTITRTTVSLCWKNFHSTEHRLHDLYDVWLHGLLGRSLVAKHSTFQLLFSCICKEFFHNNYHYQSTHSETGYQCFFYFRLCLFECVFRPFKVKFS